MSDLLEAIKDLEAMGMRLRDKGNSLIGCGYRERGGDQIMAGNDILERVRKIRAALRDDRKGR